MSIQTPLPSGSATAPALKEIHTRFLFPFFFDLPSAGEKEGGATLARLVERFIAMRLSRKDAPFSPDKPLDPPKKPFEVWTTGTVPALYREEFLDHVVRLLFDAEYGESRYLVLDKELQRTLFHDATLHNPSRGEKIGREIARIEPVGQGIELFLSAHGVGVVSISLGVCRECDPLVAAEFNYRLARLHGGRRNRGDGRVGGGLDFRLAPVGEIRVGAAKRGDLGVPANVAIAVDAPADPPATLPPSPPLVWSEARGGVFSLIDLVEELLGPLGENRPRPAQDEFSAYTVGRFSAEVDFGSAAIRELIAPVLAGLAQIEEPTHAGAAAGEAAIANAVLNRRHWAAVGQLGVAHLVADQPPPAGQDAVPFNEMRVGRIRDKYFVPYLMALNQRLFLHRTSGEASEIFCEGQIECLTDAVSALRERVLRFGLRGQFTQVSHREVLHRYYQLTREGLDVPTAWADVRQALSDFDTQLQHARQMELTSGMQKNLDVVAHVQIMVEWIEIFLVSVYAGHLWHMMDHEPPGYLAKGIKAVFHPLGLDHDLVWIFAIASGFVTYLVLKPWRLKQEEHD